MENLLKLNLDVLKEVSRMITVETGCNIIICDHSGEIIEATQAERIGRKHMGSIEIMSGEKDEAVITTAQEAYYKNLGTDTRAGYNYLIAIEGIRVGSLGVAGDPEYLRPIVRIAAKTISTYITEYIKEKRKNSILQKMARIAEELRNQSFERIDYQVFADDLRIISGARFILINIYDKQQFNSSVVGASACENDLNHAFTILGSNIIGTSWHINKEIKNLIHYQKSVFISDFMEFSQQFIPLEQAFVIKQSLDLGGVYILEIAHFEKMLGDIVFFMPSSKLLQNETLVELYAAQVGQLLMRFQSEAELKKSQMELNKALTILDSFWHHSPNPICIFDETGNIVKVSRYMSDLCQCSPEGFTGKNIFDLFEQTEADKLIKLIRKAAETRETIFFSQSVDFSSTEKRFFDNWIFPISNQEQDTPLIGLVGLDITDRIKTEQTLEYLSMHDPLTGVYNRTFFDKELDHLCGSDQYPISIITIDTDCLKIINDTMGHHHGDESLKSLSLTLSASIRETDVVARIGGDEFVIILPKADKAFTESVIAQIQKNISLFNQDKVKMPISASMGCATANTSKDCLHEALAKADEQMYHHKLFHKESNRSRITDALLCTLSERDCITQGNLLRLLDLCIQVGHKRKLSAKSLSALSLLSKVHDLGKVGIPDSILLKPGPLDEKEWEIIHQHPEKGYRIAVVSPELYDIADLILKHHERWDGKGYPLGLRGREIPIECRILAVVYSYDAMITGRPYSQAKSKDEAIAELIRCSGSQFDPEIVNIFIEVIRQSQEEYRLF